MGGISLEDSPGWRIGRISIVLVEFGGYRFFATYINTWVIVAKYALKEISFRNYFIF